MKFGTSYDLDVYTDDWDLFLSKITAVYIASPHNTHFDYIQTALNNGKHVLCEKPMVLEKAQAKEVFKLAKDNNLVLMEAIRTAYAPGFIQLLNIAQIGSIGKIHDVEAGLTKLVPPNTRAFDIKENGGSFTELASAPLLVILKLLGKKFTDLRFESILDNNGADIYTKAFFKYDNCLASVKVGLGVKSEGQLIISGSHGYIIVDAPWWNTESFEIRYEDTNRNEKFFIKFRGEGLRYEINEFAVLINGGNDKKGFKLTNDESIAIAGIMEEFLKTRK